MPFNRFSYDKTVNVKKRVGISNGKLPEILTVKKVKSICRIRLEITVVRLRNIENYLEIVKKCFFIFYLKKIKQFKIFILNIFQSNQISY